MFDHTPIKACSKCKQLYPATNEFFHKHKGRKDGLCDLCKPCNRAHAKHWRNENPERHRQYTRDWRKENPEKARDLVRRWCANNPERRRQVVAQSYRRNRGKVLATSKARYWANHDKQLERKKRFYDSHKEQWRVQSSRRRARLKHAEGTYCLRDIEAQYKSQKGLCWWCEESIRSGYEIDHMVPLSRGGSNNPENLVLTCEFCNRSKGSKLPSEWSERLL